MISMNPKIWPWLGVILTLMIVTLISMKSLNINMEQFHPAMYEEWQMKSKINEPCETSPRDYVSSLSGPYNLDKDPFIMRIKQRSHHLCSDIYSKNVKVPWNIHVEQSIIHERLKKQVQIPWNTEQLRLHEIFQRHVRQITPAEGDSGQFPDQQRIFYDLMHMKRMRTICEVGFNKGKY